MKPTGLIIFCISLALCVGGAESALAQKKKLSSNRLFGCLNESTGQVRFKARCSKKQTKLDSDSDFSALTLQLEGLVGEDGPAGDKGPKGDVGPVGLQGPVGFDGAKGATGPDGPQGAQGIDGPAGAMGQQGNQGPIGPQGPQGPQGIPGTEEGPIGPDGDEGPQGPAGLNAVFDFAVSSMSRSEIFSVDEVASITALCSSISGTVGAPPDTALGGECYSTDYKAVLLSSKQTASGDGWTCTWVNPSGSSFVSNITVALGCVNTLAP
ncbi:MAG: collagen-like protein [Bdellovibrionales bacterium]|nr:collagen-like protein [Bdellovibrionales bacterium]